MKGAKVQGHSSMVRSSACPGLILCVDHAGGEAALKSRRLNEERENIIANQQAQIDSMSAIIQLLAQKLGLEGIPSGGNEND